MRFGVLFLIILFLALFGKGTLGYSLVVPFVFSFVFSVTARISFFVAFMSGVILSLVGGSHLGRESLALLVAAGVIQLYARRFSSRHILYFVGFSGVGSVVYSLVDGRSINPVGVLIDMFLVLLFVPLVLWWKRLFLSDDIVLRV